MTHYKNVFVCIVWIILISTYLHCFRIHLKRKGTTIFNYFSELVIVSYYPGWVQSRGLHKKKIQWTWIQSLSYCSSKNCVFIEESKNTSKQTRNARYANFTWFNEFIRDVHFITETDLHKQIFFFQHHCKQFSSLYRFFASTL